MGPSLERSLLPQSRHEDTPAPVGVVGIRQRTEMVSAAGPDLATNEPTDVRENVTNEPTG